MKKTIFSVFSFLIVIALTVSLLCVPVSAAGTIISFSKNSIAVGDSLAVTITMDAGEAMYAVGCTINYDAAKLEFVSGSATGGAGSLSLVESPSGENKVTYVINFKALAAGSATVSIADCKYETLSESKSFTGASANVTITDSSLSNNANLSALSGSAGSLSPKFSQGTTSYTVNVSNDVTDFNVFATAADKAATVKVPSTTKLKLGKNTIKVVVTAANGSTKTYTLNVIRSEEPVTSEPVTSEPEVTDENAATVTVNDLEYTILNDLTDVTLLKDFAISSSEFEGKTVAVAVDKKEMYKIYYLKSTDLNEIAPFTYDEETNTFVPLKYISKFGRDYIYCEIPEDKVAPAHYFITSYSIDGQNYKCYTNSDTSLKDFYYIYCYYDGEIGFYRYDAKEDTMQRYPELVLTDKVANAPVDEKQPDNMISRIKALSTNAKIIFAAAFFAGVCVFAIFILLIIRTILRNKYGEDNGDLDDDFEELNLITSDETEVKNTVPTTEEE